jgi:hypothetical protein
VTIYVHWLSDEPKYLICSYRAARFLGSEAFGYLLVEPDKYCPDKHAYAVGDEIIDGGGA